MPKFDDRFAAIWTNRILAVWPNKNVTVEYLGNGTWWGKYEGENFWAYYTKNALRGVSGLIPLDIFLGAVSA